MFIILYLFLSYLFVFISQIIIDVIILLLDIFAWICLVKNFTLIIKISYFISRHFEFFILFLIKI